MAAEWWIMPTLWCAISQFELVPTDNTQTLLTQSNANVFLSDDYRSFLFYRYLNRESDVHPHGGFTHLASWVHQWYVLLFIVVMTEIIYLDAIWSFLHQIFLCFYPVRHPLYEFTAANSASMLYSIVSNAQACVELRPRFKRGLLDPGVFRNGSCRSHVHYSMYNVLELGYQNQKTLLTPEETMRRNVRNHT